MNSSPPTTKPYEGDSGDDSDEKPTKRSGRRKIKIEYIEDKNRRHITFSKRKSGIMKKAYELSTLTGTQVLLLVVSETGLVYTFTTVKLQPIVTKPEGKNLIQSCLNAPDPNTIETEPHAVAAIEASSPRSNSAEEQIEPSPSSGYQQQHHHNNSNNSSNGVATYPTSYPAGQTHGMSGNGYPPPAQHPSYSGYQQHSGQQQPYGMPYYGQQQQHNQQQQHHHQQQQQHYDDYWTKQDDRRHDR